MRRHVADGGQVLGQQPGQVPDQSGQDHLGFGVAEAHIELEHLGAFVGQHEPGVEHAAVVDALGSQRGQGGFDRFRHRRLD